VWESRLTSTPAGPSPPAAGRTRPAGVDQRHPRAVVAHDRDQALEIDLPRIAGGIENVEVFLHRHFRHRRAWRRGPHGGQRVRHRGTVEPVNCRCQALTVCARHTKDTTLKAYR
jgi:hypothetical protein